MSRTTYSTAHGQAVARALEEHGSTQGTGSTWNCPNRSAHAHGDRNRSLVVDETPDRVLLRCHGGCDFRDVCAAIGWEPRMMFAAYWDARARGVSHQDAPRIAVLEPRPRPPRNGRKATRSVATAKPLTTPAAAAPDTAGAGDLFGADKAREAWADAIAYTATVRDEPRPNKSNTAALAYLGHRKLAEAIAARGDAEPLAALLPPGSKIAPRGYRLAAPLYNAATGELQAVQLRYIGTPPGDRAKTSNPRGSRAGGSLFANGAGRRLLRREADAPREVVLVEGLTDFLAVSLADEGRAVLGVPGVAMLEGALTVTGKPAPWLKGCTLTIALDNDTAGQAAADKAETVARAGGAHLIRRATWTRTDGGPAKDACDVLADGRDAVRRALTEATYTATPAARFIVASKTLCELIASPPPPLRSWFGDGLVIENELATLVGASYVGKTWLAMQLLEAMARGNALFGIATEQCPVGFIELEIPERKVFERWKTVLDGGKPPEDVHILTRNSLPPGGIDVLDGATADHLGIWLQEYGIRFVVVDALRRIHSAEENSNTEMARVMDAIGVLRSYGASVLLLHHEAKAGGHGGDRNRVQQVNATRGAVVVQNHVLTSLNLYEHPRAAGFYALTVGGSNTSARAGDTLAWLARLAAGPFEASEPPPPELLESAAGGGARKRRERHANVERVFRELADVGERGLTRRELAIITGLNPETVRTILAQLRREHRIGQVGRDGNAPRFGLKSP